MTMKKGWRDYQHDLNAADELSAITKRQTMTVIRTAESYPLDFDETLKPPRDYRLIAAAVGIGVGLAGLFVTLLITIVTSK